MKPIMAREFNIDAGLLSSVLLLGAYRTAEGADEETPPEVIHLTGIVRDFREHAAQSGHPDFEVTPAHGFGLYCGNVSLLLDADGKPAFTGLGRKVGRDARDAAGRPIAPHLCNRRYIASEGGYTLVDDPSLGDQSPWLSYSDHGGIQSSSTFHQWFRDTMGVNMSKPVTIDFHQQDDGMYVFDDALDPFYSDLGGFFPIEDELFGNPGGKPDRNFHFTFELHTQFKYHADQNQTFRFIGDDDVFVYIDGRLAIDLGGVHAANDQFVDLGRLGLQDGGTYTLDFFFAERHRTESNCRIETNLTLESLALPSITAAFD